MTLEEIRERLQQLTDMRRKGLDDKIISALLAGTGQKPRTTAEQLRQAEEDFEKQLPGWWLIWEDVNKSYGIIPSE